MRDVIFAIMKKYWKLLLSTLIVSALGCSIMIGLSAGHMSLKTTLYQYIYDYNYPDAQITTTVNSIDKIDKIRNMEGIKEINTRLVFDTVMISPEKKYLSTRVMSYTEDDFQKMYVWSSLENNYEDSILIDYKFAENNNIVVGDKVTIRVIDEYREFVISKIVSLPETLSVQITDKSWGANSDFGFIYASTDLLKKESTKDKKEAKELIEQKNKDLDSKESDSKETYNKYKKKLSEAYEKLKNETSNYYNSKRSIDEKLTELKKVNKELNSKKDELKKNEKQITDAKNKLVNGIIELEQSEDKLHEAKATLNKIDTSLVKIDESYEKLSSDKTKNSMELVRLLPEDTTLEEVYKVTNNTEKFIELANEAGYNINVNDTCHDAANTLEQITNKIEEDYKYLNDESTVQLVKDIKNNFEEFDEENETWEEYYERTDGFWGKHIKFDEVIYIYYKGQKMPKFKSFQNSYVLAYNGLNFIPNKMNNHSWKLKEDIWRTNSENVELAYFTAKTVNAGLYYYTNNNKTVTASKIINNLDEEITVEEVFKDIDEAHELSNTLFTNPNEVTIGEFVEIYDNLDDKVNETKKELTNSRKKIVNELKKQGIKENEIDDAVVKIQKQVSEARDNLSVIEKNEADVKQGLSEIESNISEVNSGIKELEDAINDGRNKIYKAERELKIEEEELNSNWLETTEQFSEARLEIKNALKDVENENDYDNYFNQILFIFDDSVDHEVLLENIVNELNDITVKNSYTYNHSPVKRIINENLSPIKTMSTFMPIIFFGITLVVVFLFMSLIIKQCRREIGILKALGYKKKEMRIVFCTINLLVLDLAIMLGAIIGVVLMFYIGNVYKDFFPLPFFDYKINWKMYVISIFLTVVIGQIATLFSTSAIEKIEPVEAMSRIKTDNTKNPYLLEKITNIFKPLTKFLFITSFRNKVKYILLSICIASSVMMIFSSLSFITSKNHLLKELYEDRIKYDAQIYFKEYPDNSLLNELDAINSVSNIEVVDYFDVKIKANGKEKSVLLNAVPTDTNNIAIYNQKNEKLNVTKDGIILTKNTADKLKVEKGDNVEINNVTVKVSDISEQNINRIEYISIEKAKEIGVPNYETVLLDISEKDEQLLLEKLIDNDKYLYTVFTHLSYSNNKRVFELYNVAAWIIIGFAIIIGFVIVLNTTLTNLLEQKRKLCMTRVLGFKHSEISKNLFVQSMLQFIISCIIGFPIGVIIAKKALSELSVPVREYAYANGIKEYIITLVLVFVYMVISHIIAMRIFKKWDIIENVKENE